ncbi:hypothetical protein BH10PSE4_BH10PSE4_28150 [soil metagenome]
MRTVNMHDAKSQLSKLVSAVERGETDQVVITRNGRRVARRMPMTAVARTPVRIGVAKGLFIAPADTSAQDAEVAALFRGRKSGGLLAPSGDGVTAKDHAADHR